MGRRRRTLKELLGDLDLIDAEMAATRRCVADLHRRGRHTASDGFPAGSGNSGGQSGVSDPTPGAALARPQADAVGKAIWDIEAMIADVAKRAQLMRNLRLFVAEIEVSERGRQNVIPECCNPHCGKSLHDEGPNGRGTSGRCNTCFEFRRTHGGVDRPAKLVDAALRRATATV